MPLPPLQVLFEDNHCLAINKPAGLATMGAAAKQQTLQRQAQDYLKAKYDKPGNAFVGVVHRLDRLVSGVVLFARTSKAAARISHQFREGSIEKVYWAVVEGTFPKAAGSLEDWLQKDREAGRVEVMHPHEEEARLSLLHYQLRGEADGLSWLEIRPQTGRTHQIRVQLAHHGFPILGDAKYGGVRIFPKGIALHARSLTFLHPVRYEPITLTAELPETWRRFRKLGLRVSIA
jgi:23S rRNA pseudouridine1911/1915/1917 synthase